MIPQGVGAIVTGGASGLGAASATKLAREGARVAIFMKMKKIDKKQQLSTAYQNWENALNQANQAHPTYNSSNGEYYQDIVMDALRCQNGLCAYTEIQLCPPPFLTPDNWENGRYKNKNRHHNGQLEHFDERLKWKDKDTKKRSNRYLSA